MSIPNSTIYICSVAFNSSFEHTPFFESKSAQQSTFAECVQRTYSAYTFLRETTSIKVQAHKNDTETWNYLYFTNDSGANYYYYFIDRIEYINDQTVELFLTLDVMQTYHFRYNLLPSFVERKHTMTDVPGDNLVEEDLDLGEYINYGDYTTSTMDTLCILVLSTIDLHWYSSQLKSGTYPNETVKEHPSLGSKIDRVFSGATIYACDIAHWGALQSVCNNLDKIGMSDCIISMYMFPKNFVSLASSHSWNTSDSPVLPEVYGFKTDTYSVFRPTDLNGYVPTNKKLLTYPYSYLYVHNNMGTGAIFKYELSSISQSGEKIIDFNITGSILPDGGVKIFPRLYRNSSECYEEGITITGFPTCAWNQDAYKLWLAQNQSSHDLAMATGVLSIVAGAVAVGSSVATGGLTAIGGGGAMLSGASQIANLLASKKDASVQPMQSKGSVSGSVNVFSGNQHFTLQRKVIQDYKARMIDDYFSLYGYAIKRVMKPQGTANGVDYDIRCARKCYTYIKTQGCKIRGSVPSDHAKQIQQIYDKGITFWRNGQSIGEFWLDNSPL